MTNSHHDRPATNSSENRSPAASGSLTRFALTIIVLLGLALGGVVAIETFLVERIPELTPELLSAAQQRWEEHGPKSYDLDLEIEGAQPGVVHVEVRDGVTTAMQRDGLAPTQRRVWDVWAVPGMFDTIEREFDIAADPQHEMDAPANTNIRLRAEFDPKYGYPERFHRIVFGGGAEVYWKVTNFQPE